MLLKSVSETLELWVIIRTPTGIGRLAKRPGKTHFDHLQGWPHGGILGEASLPGAGPARETGVSKASSKDRTMALSNPMTGWDHKGIYAAGHSSYSTKVYWVPTTCQMLLQHPQESLPSKSLQYSGINRLIYYFGKYRCYDEGTHRVRCSEIMNKGSLPGLGRSPEGRHGNPTLIFLPGKAHG